MVRFDNVRFTRRRSGGFNNVRVDSPLRQPLYIFQFQRFFIEYFNEDATDDFTFSFRIVFTRQRSGNALLPERE